jgi:hypothetical protein
MIKLDELLDMWKKDSVIDEINLDSTSIDSAKLHSKYLELLSVTKLQLKRKEMEFKVLLKDKWLWYENKMPKQQMDDLGWKYDPFEGLSIRTKADKEHYYSSDKDIQFAQGQIEYLKVLLETLEEILNNIRWRHSNIKNIIEWRKFTSGA